IPVLPAAAGLWAPAGDMVRLATGWSSLLPAALAREALTPQATAEPGGARAGLSWLFSPRGDIAMQAGAQPGASAALLVRVRDHQVRGIMPSMFISLDRIHDRVL